MTVRNATITETASSAKATKIKPAVMEVKEQNAAMKVKRPVTVNAAKKMMNGVISTLANANIVMRLIQA